jgi:hypothetical protein
MVKAKADISVPSRDTAWPTQTIVKANIPLGRLVCMMMISLNPSLQDGLFYFMHTTNR